MRAAALPIKACFGIAYKGVQDTCCSIAYKGARDTCLGIEFKG